MSWLSKTILDPLGENIKKSLKEELKETLTDTAEDIAEAGKALEATKTQKQNCKPIGFAA